MKRCSLTPNLQAYCLYKSGEHEEALKTLGIAPESSVRYELQAQILYRLGRHSECISTYETLSRLEGSVLSDEMKSNLVAAYVGAGRSPEVPFLLNSLKLSPRESFDLAYNVSCALCEEKKWDKAEEMLFLARRFESTPFPPQKW